MGCSIVYNYVDLVVCNDTSTTFQLLAHVGERHLRGELRADRETARSYRVDARGEVFWRHEVRVFRANEIWRTVRDRRTGEVVRDELVTRNSALVKYLPDPSRIVDVAPLPTYALPTTTVAESSSSVSTVTVSPAAANRAAVAPA